MTTYVTTDIRIKTIGLIVLLKRDNISDISSTDMGTSNGMGYGKIPKN